MTPTYHTATDQRCESSELERGIITRLQEGGVPVVPQVKLGQNWVFDGAINGTKILVEIHGDYWHTRPEVRERDIRKQLWASREGYQIVTIWESEYNEDPDGKLAEALATIETLRRYMATIDAPAEQLGPAIGDKGNTPKYSHYGDWRDRFLAVLGTSGTVLEACIAAGVSRKTAYKHSKEDLGFAEDWRMALADAADAALAEYRKRGQQQSDRAMEFFIKSRNPEEFGEKTRVEVTGAGGGPIEVMTPEQRAARAAVLVERARQRALEAGQAGDDDSNEDSGEPR